MHIAIIGAGYAGLAAAVELLAQGKPGQTVTVFEASRTLGGRARAVELNGMTVDNGQHILLGACSQTLRLMQMVGADPKQLFKRRPLHLEFPGEFHLSAPRLPAPLHLLAALVCAQGLDWREKRAAIRLMQGLQGKHFMISPDSSVTAWLNANRAPSRQRRLLWEPLCVAALNTPADQASAQMLANVLRDSLASHRAASDLLIPQVNLSALFPEPAAAFITRHGGRLHRSQRVTSLAQTSQGWRINDQVPFDHVVLAVAPYHLAAIAPGLAACVQAFTWEPIVTSYLAYPAAAHLSHPMLGIADGLAQWLFDRGQLGGQAGLIAAVISARGRHLDLPNHQLEAQIHQEIAKLIPAGLAPHHTRTLIEKRATFSCTPGLVRPAADTGLPGLWLAGDYVTSGDITQDYPATIEGAVRSGVRAAQRIRAATEN
ncbi:MAG: hydroxysqualene dehydroxylase HpnE [Rugosibacter sp.]|jgi:squalene-associated FAD-dependent desaturase|nr:hydroxysqualene dehydroxylase [Rugosibacter sp.]